MDTAGLLVSLLRENPDPILAVDPGETVGLAWVEGERIVTASPPATDFTSWLVSLMAYQFGGWKEDVVPWPIPANLVVEEWRLYPWMTKSMTWSDLFTPRLIGRIEMTAEVCEIPVHFQGANIIKALPWVQVGKNDHQRDAAKHLVRYMLDKQLDQGLVNLP